MEYLKMSDSTCYPLSNQSLFKIIVLGRTEKYDARKLSRRPFCKSTDEQDGILLSAGNPCAGPACSLTEKPYAFLTKDKEPRHARRRKKEGPCAQGPAMEALNKLISEAYDKTTDPDSLVGQNNGQKTLMMCKIAWPYHAVPSIDHALQEARLVHTLGDPLTFDEERAA